MNNIEVLKKDFYSRFGVSKNKLYNQKCGMVYTLLGFYDVYGARSLNCVMPPYVYAVGRKLDGNKLEIENASSINEMLLNIKDYTTHTSQNGAQILFDTDNCDCFNYSLPLKVCATKLLMKINNISSFDYKTVANQICSEKDVSECITLLNGKKGYCADINGEDYTLSPFPLIGYKVIVAYADELKCDFDYDVVKKATEYVKINLPDITHLYKISVGDFNRISNNINDKNVFDFLKFVVDENERIDNVVVALNKCDINPLFDAMKKSSMQMFGILKNTAYKECVYNSLLKLSYVRAFRFVDNKILVFVDDANVDFTINEVRNIFNSEYSINLKFVVSGNF